MDCKEYLTTNVNGLKFTYQAGNFFQNNYYVLPLLVDYVKHYASLPIQRRATDKEIIPMTHLVDCY